MELQDRYIRFDWAVKRLLRHKANFGVLEGFLTVLIGDEIHRVDIKALNSKNEIVIIEIQNTRELYYLERILYGVAKAITEHISLGETYYKVKKMYWMEPNWKDEWKDWQKDLQKVKQKVKQKDLRKDLQKVKRKD